MGARSRRHTTTSFRSSSLRRRRTFFDLLPSDGLLEIATHTIKRSSSNEKGKLPSLFLDFSGPFASICGKKFSTLQFETNKPASLSSTEISIDCERDETFRNFVISRCLPYLRLIRTCSVKIENTSNVLHLYRAVKKLCSSVNTLEIFFGVLPDVSISFVTSLIRNLNSRLTKLTIINNSRLKGWGRDLKPLAETVAQFCTCLVRFEFRGHYATEMIPVYSALGGSLQEVEVIALSNPDWAVIIQALHDSCHYLTSIHLGSGLVLRNSVIIPSDQLVSLLVSYGPQLRFAELTMLTTEHMALLFSICPSLECAVTYGEIWQNHVRRIEHLSVAAPRLRTLCLDSVMDTEMEFLANAMSRCKHLEHLMVDDIQTNNGVCVMFSGKMPNLRRVSMGITGDNLSERSIIALAEATDELRVLELRLDSSLGAYERGLCKIAVANRRIERLVITEFGTRGVRSCLTFLQSFADFLACAEHLVEVEINLKISLSSTRIERLVITEFEALKSRHFSCLNDINQLLPKSRMSRSTRYR